jgi:hypothetical protein
MNESNVVTLPTPAPAMVSPPFCGNALRQAISSFDNQNSDLSFTGPWSPPERITQELKQEAALHAKRLRSLAAPLPKERLKAWLATLGTLCAGSLSVNDARAKIVVLAEFLSDYPGYLFTKENLAEIAKDCKFIPSFSEIAKVLDRKKIDGENQIARCEHIAKLAAPNPDTPRPPPSPSELEAVSAIVKKCLSALGQAEPPASTNASPEK